MIGSMADDPPVLGTVLVTVGFGTDDALLLLLELLLSALLLIGAGDDVEFAW